MALVEDIAITHRIPMTIRRRGVEMRLTASKADPALLKAIARARGWFDELIAGRTVSMVAIAQREGISDRYVSTLMPLAFLAPDIVEAIASRSSACRPHRRNSDPTHRLVPRLERPAGAVECRLTPHVPPMTRPGQPTRAVGVSKVKKPNRTALLADGEKGRVRCEKAPESSLSGSE